MSESFEYREVTHFTVGAVGDPGDRTFFLQVGDSLGYISIKLEKQQAQALAQFLQTVLDDLPTPEDLSEPADLREPAIAEWVVGQIAVGVDESDGEIVLVIEELTMEPEEELVDASVSEGARLRAHINVAQAAQYIATTKRLSETGRPPCRLCGQPLDPSGHACPRLN